MLSICNGRIPSLAQLGWYAPLLIGLPCCLHPTLWAAAFCPHWADSSLHPAMRALTSAPLFIGLPCCLHPTLWAAAFCPHWADSSLHPA
jgi:hypothetical protein